MFRSFPAKITSKQPGLNTARLQIWQVNNLSKWETAIALSLFTIHFLCSVRFWRRSKYHLGTNHSECLAKLSRH